MAAKKNPLDALIDRIGHNAKSLRDDIQAALIGCALDAFEHKSDARMKRLFNAAGGGARLKAMRIWCMALAPIYFKDGAPCFSKDRLKQLHEAHASVADYEIYLREHQAWHQIEESGDEKAPQGYSAATLLINEQKRLDAAIAKAVKNADEETADILQKARDVIADIIAKAENVALFLNAGNEAAAQK